MLAMSPFNLAGASTGTMAQCFTAVINGASNGIDTSINAMFTAFKNAGYTRMCIRPLWEFDDTQTSLISQYQSAFAHIANLAYSFVGMKIYTVFNPLPHGGVANWYPGDSVVDWIGIDESANWGGQGVYSNPLNLSVSSYTVGGCATFAAAGGRGAGSLAKPVAICEGGVANSAQTTGTGANNENFSTTLNGTINATQTSIVVSSASGFPGTPFPIQIGTEWLNVTNVSGTTLTINGTPGSGGTGRGYNGTTAASHNSGTAVTYGGYCAWLCNCLTAFKQTGATVILFGYYNGTDVGTDERWNTVAADTAAVVNFINLCPVWSGNLSTTGH
jgi:hypothetical protein